MSTPLSVYTGGTFDLFHWGHARFLEQCSRLGDVCVSLNTDEFIQFYKGSNPVMSYQERLTTLESCKWVTSVIQNFGGADSKIAIESTMPDIIAVGSDWEGRDYYSQMGFTQNWLDARGISLVYLPYTIGISSTDIKNRLKS